MLQSVMHLIFGHFFSIFPLLHHHLHSKADRPAGNLQQHMSNIQLVMHCSPSRALKRPDSASFMNTQLNSCARLHATNLMGLSGTIGGERKRGGEEEGKQAGSSEHSECMHETGVQHNDNGRSSDHISSILQRAGQWVLERANFPNRNNLEKVLSPVQQTVQWQRFIRTAGLCLHTFYSRPPVSVQDNDFSPWWLTPTSYCPNSKQAHSFILK